MRAPTNEARYMPAIDRFPQKLHMCYTSTAMVSVFTQPTLLLRSFLRSPHMTVRGGWNASQLWQFMLGLLIAVFIGTAASHVCQPSCCTSNSTAVSQASHVGIATVSMSSGMPTLPILPTHDCAAHDGHCQFILLAPALLALALARLVLHAFLFLPVVQPFSAPARPPPRRLLIRRDPVALLLLPPSDQPNRSRAYFGVCVAVP